MPRFGAATKSIFWHAAADGATAPTPRDPCAAYGSIPPLARNCSSQWMW